MKDLFFLIFIPFYTVFIALFSYFVSKRLIYKNSFLFIFLFNFFMNVFGLLFTFLLLFLFRKKEKKIDANIKSFDLEPLFLHFPSISLAYRPGVGDFLEIKEGDEDRKVKLLSYIRDNISKEGIFLFYKSLSGEGDASRRFSFGALNAIEKDISEKILFFEKRGLFKEVALLYWEFVYLKLATGDLKDFYLNCAKEYVKKALRENAQDSDLYVLLGKIYLEKKDFGKSREAFKKALFFQAPKRSVLPYLLEISFKTKNNDFKDILNELKDIKYNPKIISLIDLWSKSERG